MKKLFICLFSVISTFILSVNAGAASTIINFEDLNVDSLLSDQYSNQGIYFRDSLSASSTGSSAAIRNGYGGDQGHRIVEVDPAKDLYIIFTNSITPVSCDKWEDGTGDENTIIWDFFIYTSDVTPVLTVSNSDKLTWSTTVFNTQQEISVIRISGDTLVVDGNATLYYLDNLTFTPKSSVVPEPFSFFLLGVGLMGLAGVKRRFPY